MRHFLDLWPLPSAELRAILDNAKSRKASRMVNPLEAASPAAAKKIASNTPDDPPIVWLSSVLIAR